MSQFDRMLVMKALIICLIMFAFSFAMVPLYSALCKATGIDGKGLLQQDSTFTKEIDASRLITIEDRKSVV